MQKVRRPHLVRIDERSVTGRLDRGPALGPLQTADVPWNGLFKLGLIPELRLMQKPAGLRSAGFALSRGLGRISAIGHGLAIRD